MSILLVSMLVLAVLLLLVLIPAIGLQSLLRLVGPPPARRPPGGLRSARGRSLRPAAVGTFDRAHDARAMAVL
jgi:hypothetical protein